MDYQRIKIAKRREVMLPYIKKHLGEKMKNAIIKLEELKNNGFNFIAVDTKHKLVEAFQDCPHFCHDGQLYTDYDRASNLYFTKGDYKCFDYSDSQNEFLAYEKIDADIIENVITVSFDCGNTKDIDKIISIMEQMESEKVVEVVNLTPHDIVILNADGSEKTRFTSEGLARVQASQELSHVFVDQNGFTHEVYSASYGEVTGLPEQSEGVLYVVSGMIKSALPNRTDLICPNSLLMHRENGIPKGTEAFQN